MIWPFTRKTEKKDVADTFFDLLIPSGVTASGLTVTAEQALRQPTVLACMRIITETVGQLPLHAYIRNPDGSVERDRTSVFHRMFTKRPNEWTTAFDFKVRMQADVLMHGHAFALINRDREKKPRTLQKLPARSVSVEEDRLTGEPTYRVTLNEGGSRTYSYRDIIHLNGMLGLSIITQAREAIGLALRQEQELSKTLANGQRPAGILGIEGTLTDEALTRATKQFKALGDTKGTAIIDGSPKYTALGITNVDAQFLELRRHQVAEIARAFRVPLHMLQELERITHQNAEQLGRQFLQFTMLPHLTMWQQELNLKLMDEKSFTEFLTDDLARADLAARMEAFAKAVSSGILNPNEVRAMENRSPYRGGDVFLRPLNMEGATDA